jgi:HAD superfamily hydrolase (TIGR01509 family)
MVCKGKQDQRAMDDDPKRKGTVKAAAFDLEGTIVDLEALHHAAHLRAAAERGIDLSWEQAVALVPSFIGGPDEQVASELASLVPGKVNPEDLLRAKREYFQEQYLGLAQVSPRPGFLPFLKWITDRGILVAVGTVTTRAFAEELLNRAGIATYYSAIHLVAREDTVRPKPAPDVYIKTAELCGISCTQQLVFEDSPVGVIAGIKAGSQVVAIPTVHTESLKKRLYSKGARAVFSAWDYPELRILVLQMTLTND